MRTCEICGTALIRYQQFTCSRDCFNARRAKMAKKDHSSPYKEIKVAPVVRQTRVIETDADQARIKKELDERYGIGNGPAYSLKGTPEWDAALSQISRPGEGRKVSPLYGLAFASNRMVSMRDNRNERYVRNNR